MGESTSHSSVSEKEAISALVHSRGPRWRYSVPRPLLSALMHWPCSVAGLLASSISHVVGLRPLLSAEAQSYTMVENEGCAGFAASEKSREENHADDHVDAGRCFSIIPTGSFSATSDPPAVEVGKEDDIVHDSMSDCNLDAWYHAALLLAVLVLLPWSPILGDHAHQLLVARHDGWDSGDETGTEEEVGETSDVEEGSRSSESAGQEFRLDIGRGQGIDDVETPRQNVEGNWEVHEGRMCWMTMPMLALV